MKKRLVLADLLVPQKTDPTETGGKNMSDGRRTNDGCFSMYSADKNPVHFH